MLNVTADSMESLTPLMNRITERVLRVPSTLPTNRKAAPNNTKVTSKPTRQMNASGCRANHSFKSRQTPIRHTYNLQPTYLNQRHSDPSFLPQTTPLPAQQRLPKLTHLTDEAIMEDAPTSTTKTTGPKTTAKTPSIEDVAAAIIAAHHPKLNVHKLNHKGK